MDISVIIVNYKSPQLAIDCIESLKRSSVDVSYEIIVVDNCSEDNSQSLITSAYPEVIWIEMTYNSGFARANNAGIRTAKGKYVLLLNSDTIFIEPVLKSLVSEMDKDVSLVASSVQLLNADQSFQNSGNYFSKGGLNTVLTLPFLSSFARSIGNFVGAKKHSIVNSNEEVEVDWISGAFMFVRKDALNENNLLDENFFLFSEEIEWCSRLKKIGKIKVFPNLKVIHLEGGTVKKTMEQQHSSYFPLWEAKGLQLMLSNLLRIRKQYNVFWMLLIFSVYVAEVPVFFIGSVFSAEFSVSMSLDYAKNVARLFLYLPKLLVNKNYFYKTIG